MANFTQNRKSIRRKEEKIFFLFSRHQVHESFNFFVFFSLVLFAFLSSFRFGCLRMFSDFLNIIFFSEFFVETEQQKIWNYFFTCPHHIFELIISTFSLRCFILSICQFMIFSYLKKIKFFMAHKHKIKMLKGKKNELENLLEVGRGMRKILSWFIPRREDGRSMCQKFFGKIKNGEGFFCVLSFQSVNSCHWWNMWIILDFLQKR